MTNEERIERLEARLQGLEKVLLRVAESQIKLYEALCDHLAANGLITAADAEAEAAILVAGAEAAIEAKAKAKAETETARLAEAEGTGKPNPPPKSPKGGVEQREE